MATMDRPVHDPSAPSFTFEVALEVVNKGLPSHLAVSHLSSSSPLLSVSHLHSSSPVYVMPMALCMALCLSLRVCIHCLLILAGSNWRPLSKLTNIPQYD